MDRHALTVLSLCSGAGGLELGLKLALPECRTVCYVEGEAYAAAILAARMEDAALDAAPVWSDVRSFDPAPWRGCVDIVTAGYPCQPFSIAGRKQAEADPRHLWPFIREIVRAVEPRLCFFENVSHHLRLGFEQVHDDLRSMGFSVAAGLFTAEEIGATHKRERLFILADRESDGWEQGRVEQSPRQRQPASARRRRADAMVHADRPEWRQGESEGYVDDRRAAERQETSGRLRKPDQANRSEQLVGDADDAGLEGWNGDGERGDEWSSWPPSPTEHEQWERIPAHLKPAVCRMADGLAHRVDRLRTSGNGVVPLAAAYAFRTLAAALARQ